MERTLGGKMRTTTGNAMKFKDGENLMKQVVVSGTKYNRESESMWIKHITWIQQLKVIKYSLGGL